MKTPCDSMSNGGMSQWEMEDIDEMIEDFRNAAKVAPRLVNLLRNISDR